MQPGFPARILVCAAWLIAASAAALMLSDYERKPGKTAEVPPQWPYPHPLRLDSERDTLLLFAHPKCPCTRASLEELNRLLATHAEKLAVHVLFINPSSVSNRWTQTTLKTKAEAIPGVTVHDDLDAQLARKFGAKTSGFVVLYNPRGELLFHGGMTESRGHAGDNANKDALIRQIDRMAEPACDAPVFGCPLLNLDSKEAQ